MESTIARRSGQVLLKNTILKADHFPGNRILICGFVTNADCSTGCQNKTLTPDFKEAPNFRQVLCRKRHGTMVYRSV